ncbi:MAG: ADP-ribosylglycohydrolase family protein [Phycisphaerales bacterium]|nr:ADP-ribosylglycohydrolase family protein [Phycisphaerales bacterium]
MSDDQLLDRMYGAWLGRCAGCALGKPVEGFMRPHNGLSSKDRIKTYLQAIDPQEYPLRNYFPKHSPAEDKTGQVHCYASTREDIAYMESDDDIRYTVIGQMVLAEHGPKFTSRDVANAWLTHLPYRMVCTAETQAYRNLVREQDFHVWPPSKASIDWLANATFENPYREWIGAQIRADSFGYAAPGNPALAAEFAWRDARMSHIANGIYGEMFVAAMIAAAYVLEDPLAIVEAGLAQIPRTSRLHADMRKVIALCKRHQNDPAKFEKVLDGVYKQLGAYNPVHTNNNAGLVVAALLLSRGQLHEGITIAVMGGWDTDCNGATVGSILGACLGAKKLPNHWTDPLHDTLNAQIFGYHPIAISECAKRSLKIARRCLDDGEKAK